MDEREARNAALEDAARMLDDMARAWGVTADQHDKAGGFAFPDSAIAVAAREARCVARTYAKAACKVRKLKRNG